MQHSENWYLTQIEYCRACLEYTFESNRNQEIRINILIILIIATLGAYRYILQQVRELEETIGWLPGDYEWIPVMLVSLPSIPLLFAVGVAVNALRSKVFAAESRMLPEWIAKQDCSIYTDESIAQDEDAILKSLYIENHALAQAKLHRTERYRRLCNLFMWGAIPLIIIYAFVLAGSLLV